MRAKLQMSTIERASMEKVTLSGNNFIFYEFYFEEKNNFVNFVHSVFQLVPMRLKLIRSLWNPLL